MKKELFWKIAAAVAAIYMVVSFYLFYIADCKDYKKFWYLVEAPGRCL